MDDDVVREVSEDLNNESWMDQLRKDTLEEMGELADLAEKADRGELIVDAEEDDYSRHEYSGNASQDHSYEDDEYQYGGTRSDLAPMLCLAAVTIVATVFA